MVSHLVITNSCQRIAWILTTFYIIDGGLKLIIFAFQNNGSLPANQTSYSASMTSIPNDKVTFEVSIQGSVVCAHPVGNATCASGKIERTSDAWSAYGVCSLSSKAPFELQLTRTMLG